MEEILVECKVKQEKSCKFRENIGKDVAFLGEKGSFHVIDVRELKFLKSTQSEFFKGEKRLAYLTIILSLETSFYDEK